MSDKVGDRSKRSFSSSFEEDISSGNTSQNKKNENNLCQSNDFETSGQNPTSSKLNNQQQIFSENKLHGCSDVDIRFTTVEPPLKLLKPLMAQKIPSLMSQTPSNLGMLRNNFQVSLRGRARERPTQISPSIQQSKNEELEDGELNDDDDDNGSEFFRSKTGSDYVFQSDQFGRNKRGNLGRSKKNSGKKLIDNKASGNQLTNKFRVESEDISLHSNFFEMLISVPEWSMHQYYVDFEPTCFAKRLRYSILDSCNHLFKNSLAFDGANAYSLYKLPSAITEYLTTHTNDNQKIKVIIKYVKVLEKNSKEINRINNIIFRSASSCCGFSEIGKDRALYDFKNTMEFWNNIRIIPGYHGTFSQYEDSCLLRVDISHKAINSKSVHNLLEEMLRMNFNRGKIESELVGKLVMTNYNKLLYRVEGIDWTTKITDTFERVRQKQIISFQDFYRQAYNQVINDLNQPLLDCMPTARKRNNGFQRNPEKEYTVKRVKLVPELCAITGESLLAPFKSDVIFTKEYNAMTNLDPSMRYAKIRQFVKKIKESNKMDRTWKMNFPDDVVQVPARLLKSVEVYFGNEKSLKVTEWGNELRSLHFLKTISMDNWIFVYMSQEKFKARFFEEKLRTLSGVMNFRINQPFRIEHYSHNIELIQSVGDKVKQMGQNKPQMIVFMMPKNDNVLYKAIKRLCCIDIAVPSQVLISKIIDPNNQGKLASIITKIAAQINVKLGGELWGVKFSGKRTMVVGMDRWHSVISHSVSVSAFVASLHDKSHDLSFTKWFSQAFVNDQATDYQSVVKEFFSSALRKYHTLNGYFPTTIVCYRDGVTEEENESIRVNEIAQIKEVFKVCFANCENQPCLIYIVMKKRVNARFFEKVNESKFKNPAIGTIIDRKCIRDADKEFYLISQSVTQGTVNPTQYCVILNERAPGIDLKNIQTLTFMLTHMYYNWPGQIRVPAPCHYAYKLASLVGESLLNSGFRNSPELQEKLFYI